MIDLNKHAEAILRAAGCVNMRSKLYTDHERAAILTACAALADDAAEPWKNVALKLHVALAQHTCRGCPECPGDCSSANPPVMNCPTLLAIEAFRAFDAIDPVSLRGEK